MPLTEAAPHRGWTRRNLAWVLFLLVLAVFTAGRLVGALAGRLPTVWRRSFGGVCAAIALLALTLAIAEGPHVRGYWFD